MKNCCIAFACLIPILALGGCASAVPPELATAQNYSEEALARAVQNRKIIVDAYTKELRAAYVKQMDLIQANALEQAQTTQPGGEKVVPRAIVDQVMALRQTKLAEIDAELEAKRQEFINDRNLQIAVELNAKVGEWMKVYVEDFALRAQELARLGSDIYQEASGKDRPGFIDDFLGEGQ